MLRMPEERENELVQMAQKGSTKAFTELEKQYHWLVFKVAKDILQDGGIPAAHVEAEDVTQEVFEYAFVHLKEYVPGRFYRWLWTLARIRALRKRHKLGQRESHEISCGDDDTWDSVVKEMHADVMACQQGAADDLEITTPIKFLPKQQKQDLLMYAAGYKPHEIAKKTGRNVEAVKKSLNRGKGLVKMSTFGV